MRGPAIVESVNLEVDPNGDGQKAGPRRRRLPSRIASDLVQLTTPRRKFAILGYTEHRKQAPFLHPDWEIWGLNDLYHELPDGLTLDRLRWFQVHAGEFTEQGLRPESPTDFTGGFPHPRDPNYMAWLTEWSGKGMRLYLQRPRAELPNAVVLDREAIFAYFEDGLGGPVRYFTNSISWMLAVAIMELAPEGRGKPCLEGAEIGVFGVDMMMAGGPGSEYGYQRPSCEWLLGWAMACGIKVHIPKESDLLKAAYQYGDLQGEYFRQRVQAYRNEMSRRRGEATDALEQARHAYAELTGAINCADWLLKSHMPGDPGDEGKGRVPRPDAHKPLPGGVSSPEVKDAEG